jgi:hypothetical protein
MVLGIGKAEVGGGPNFQHKQNQTNKNPSTSG